MAQNPGTYENAFDELVRSEGGTRYEDVHATFHESMRFIRDEFGYYDIFLIDAETGDILYTVDKESDFATNIYEGPYRSSGLGDLVEADQATTPRAAPCTSRTWSSTCRLSATPVDLRGQLHLRGQPRGGHPRHPVAQ